VIKGESGDHSLLLTRCDIEQSNRGIVSSQVVTPAVKFKMPIIHRIINFCITATLKTGGAYYTQVRIISETLR